MSTETISKEWHEIKPLEGFGLLKFGMSPAETRPLAEIYGPVTDDLTTEERIQEPHSRDIIIPYMGSQITMRAGKQPLGPAQRIVFNKHLFLGFMKNRLVNVQLINGAMPAFFGNDDVFAPTGKPMIQRIIEALGEAPYYNGVELYFHEHALVLGGFCSGAEQGIEYLTSAKEPRQIAVFLSHEPARVAKSTLAGLPKLRL